MQIRLRERFVFNPVDCHVSNISGIYMDLLVEGTYAQTKDIQVGRSDGESERLLLTNDLGRCRCMTRKDSSFFLAYTCVFIGKERGTR